MSTPVLFGLTPETIIRDSLYDLIPLPAEAADLLATREFLRLDGIQQLGFVSRVWPGARHTRFEHSLGVMHLMHEGLVWLRRQGAEIDDETARTGMAAGLLHDVGHYPFSHAIEELGPPIRPHEEVGRDLIVAGEIAELLRDRWRVDPERVAGLIDPPETGQRAVDRLVGGLLSGPLDVDKLDYLPRDARACSVPYGGVDTVRLLQSLRVVETAEGARVGIDAKGVPALHSLINARQEMFDNVYWHHTNRASMAMLLRAVQDAMLAGFDAAELTGHTDRSLLDRLTQDDAPQTTRQLIGHLRDRQMHKRAVEISYRAGEVYRFLGGLFHDPAGRRALELEMVERLRELTGIEAGAADILIDIPKPEKWKTQVWVEYTQPPVGFRPLMSWHEVTGIDDSTLRTYEDHRRLIRIVVRAPLRDIVATNWERLTLPLMMRQ